MWGESEVNKSKSKVEQIEIKGIISLELKWEWKK